MRQIFHIFRKDVRHHWIEILLCQAALLVFCWHEVQSWSERPSFEIDALIIALLPITWGVFVFRIVHTESLVGDSQFWITRPYVWTKLLAEKILLVLAFINLPMLIAAAILLTKAGFSPYPHVLGLLCMQLLLVQLPLLPLLALGAVTRNMAQGLLALVAVVLFIIFDFVLEEFLHNLGHRPSGDTGWLINCVLVLVCCAAIGVQYAGRKTAQSRVWLAGGGLAMIAITVASAFGSGDRDRYPFPAEPSSFHVAPAEVRVASPERPAEKDEDVEVGLPLRAWGVAPDSLGRIRGIKLTLEAPDGFLWDSGWYRHYGLIGPGENEWRQFFIVRYKDYERLKSMPLKARVAVAVEIVREHEFEGVTATAGEFAVPRVGRCRLRARDTNTLFCHSPLVGPFMTVVRVDPEQSTCDLAYKEIRTAWVPGRDSDRPDYGVSPVVDFSFDFHERTVCPGTPLSFSFPEFVEDVRSDFEIDNMNLDAYRSPWLGTDNSGIMTLPWRHQLSR